MEIRMIKKFALITLGLVLCLVLFSSPANATGYALVFEHSRADSLTVEIWLNNVQDCGQLPILAIEMHLSYDSDVLEFAYADFSTGIADNFTFASNCIEGMDSCFFAGASAGSGFSGSGMLVSLTYGCKDPANCCLGDSCVDVNPFFRLNEEIVELDKNPMAVEDHQDNLLPQEYSLGQNYPNPFNPTTTIRLQLPRATEVVLDVCNIAGQKIEVLSDGRMSAGEHLIEWDASKYASGVYLYRLRTDDKVETKKMLLLK